MKKTTLESRYGIIPAINVMYDAQGYLTDSSHKRVKQAIGDSGDYYPRLICWGHTASAQIEI